jgi:UDP-2,4-diacetamido-2,4,6-trideoxy-beta-L-altropyranose hydrolase
LLVRADASPAIGMGHAMRCLSLAGAFAEYAGGAATFLMAEPPRSFAPRALRAGADVWELRAVSGSVDDVDETVAAASAIGAEWIVLDGYHFDGAFQSGLAASGRRILALDDHGHAGRYQADLVLNQNAGADVALYRNREPSTRLLLGPSFAMLRAEFRRWTAPRPPVPARARHIVITLGGSDPDNVSTRILHGLAAVSGPLDLMLIVGAANPHQAALASAAAASPHPVEVAVDVSDMPERLAWADVAVAAAGGTSWELARVGTPEVAIVLAENQRPAAAALARGRLAVSLGWHADVDAAAIGAAVRALVDDSQRRADLSRRGRALVDGRGALRVLAAMGLITETEIAA